MDSDSAAVTLDAAGTLIRVTHPVADTYVRIAAEHGIALEAGAVAAAFRRIFPQMPALAFPGTPPGELAAAERGWWRELVRRCFGEGARHRAFDPCFEALYEHYRAPAAWGLYPEVRPLLDALDRAGIPAAVVSNFDTRLHDILRAHGVHRRFRAVLCSSEAGAAKPDSRIFLAACAALGASPDRVLHAGDDRRADRDGARAAGLQALWLRRDPDGAAGAGEPESARDLNAILQRLRC